MRILKNLAKIQGIYYLIMGIWPLLDLHSFMEVTGPKTDTWLVRTAGVLFAGIGLSFLIAQARQQVSSSTVALALASSLGIALIDVINALTMRIPVIYLVDAFLQTVFFMAWFIASLQMRKINKH